MDAAAALPANTAALRAWLRERRGVDLADYAALHRWSVQDVAGFWQTSRRRWSRSWRARRLAPCGA